MRVQSFAVAIPDRRLEDLRARLARTRWAEDLGNADWRYGVERQFLEDMVGYWRDEYDWRAQERAINQLQNFRATIRGNPLHFVHVRGKGQHRVPLLLVHGWPWTFMDFATLVGPLSDPEACGGESTDAFDLVIPSLPGFGFSMPLTTTGLTVPRLAELLHTLMTEALGYRHYAVAGGDFGAVIALQLAHAHPEQVIGVLTTIPFFPGLAHREIKPDQYAPGEQWMLERRAESQERVVSHYTVQSHEPQTLAYALVDSPVGTAAWLWERRRSWSDCNGDVLSAFDRDFLCTLASIYWLTGSIGTSLRIYWEHFHSGPVQPLHDRLPVVEVPTGFVIHPKEVMLVPRSVAARGTNLQHWSVMQRGGHFGFAEQPAQLTEEIRSFFRPLRNSSEESSIADPAEM